MEATLKSPMGQTVLEPGGVTIGSTQDSRLVLHDARVSPHHAVLHLTEQGYTITDWGSTDGTFVNDQRLAPFVPHLLTAGDRIRIGETVFTFEVYEGVARLAGQESSPASEPAALAALSQQPGVLPGTPERIPAYETPPPSPPYTPPPQQGKPPPEGRRWQMPRRWRLFALIALIILLVGVGASFLISWTVSVLPGATATVTMTPASQHLTRVYGIFAVTGTPDASQHQVQARVLSHTAKAPSKTVKVTGKGHQEATVAKGKVTISPSTGTVPASNLRVPSNSGVNVLVDVTNSISSGSQTFDAWAENAGSGGNIPAYDLDGSYHLVSDPNVNFYIQNTQAFTGGQDAHDYTFVQQSDIDSVATPLVSQLTSDAQAALQRQVRANEQFASTPECIPNIKTNHKANDRVSDVTVTVTVTCKGEVFDEQAARSMASDLLKSNATSQLSDHYALVGDTVIRTPQVATTTETGTITLNVSAEGIWVYQFSEAQKQTFGQLVAGKPLTDARDLLLKQEGVSKVTLTTDGGWGSALPESPNDIEFNMLVVPGLKTTP